MRFRKLMITAASALLLTISAASPIMARSADCLIKAGGETLFRGECGFQSDANGSFAIHAGKSGRFLENIEMVSVSILSKGRADVRGLTDKGINSRWGSARRSRKDRACWVGTDFKICAW